MTPRRMSWLPPNLATEEGQRIKVPEGGELLCVRNADNRLTLKVVYSREMMVKLSTSIFCHLRPPQLAQVADELPELLGIPHPIPPTSSPPPSTSPSAETLEPLSAAAAAAAAPSPLRIFSPLRGPVTPADDKMRMLNSQREVQNRLLDMSGSPAFVVGAPPRSSHFETPLREMIELRNPRFT
uniref:Uncharacterized protein n=1 Tax=Caenorhabditis japonica TaxID=281687 RepID=A0A8R1DZD7_CAEJA